MPITKAAGILREGRGVQWDVDAFLHYLEKNYPAVNAEAAAAELALFYQPSLKITHHS
jgi:hypothetical protein